MCDDKQYEFLKTHYGILSDLWARRDQMRMSFLKFYFLFLGAIVSVVGFHSTFDGDVPTVEDLMTSEIFIILLAICLCAGLLTFIMLQYIRLHNLRCTYDMADIAKHFDSDPRNPVSHEIVSRLKVRPNSRSGIDFTSSLIVGITNSSLAALLFSQWSWALLLAFTVMSSLQVMLWRRILKQKRVGPFDS